MRLLSGTLLLPSALLFRLEIFASVRVALAADLLYSVVNDFVLKLRQPLIRLQCIGEDAGTGENVWLMAM